MGAVVNWNPSLTLGVNAYGLSWYYTRPDGVDVDLFPFVNIGWSPFQPNAPLVTDAVWADGHFYYRDPVTRLRVYLTLEPGGILQADVAAAINSIGHYMHSAAQDSNPLWIPDGGTPPSLWSAILGPQPAGSTVLPPTDVTLSIV